MVPFNYPFCDVQRARQRRRSNKTPTPFSSLRRLAPYLEAQPAAAATAPLDPGAPNYYPFSWSKIVYQSFQDGNWEIYTTSDSGSNQIRLTDNPAADVDPRMNRGATKAAFTSKRDGNYEIYTVNLDGSQLTRLTADGKDDVGPAWAPDVLKIAFQSYRDGQAEIYTMNADGSGQTRLTSSD